MRLLCVAPGCTKPGAHFLRRDYQLIATPSRTDWGYSAESRPACNTCRAIKALRRRWMSDIGALLGVCSDLRELGRCSFLVNFNTLRVAGMRLGCGDERFEQAAWARFWRLIFQCMRAWICANIRYTDAPPYFLAALLHERAEVGTERLELFGRYEAAFAWAKTKTTPTLVKIVNRSPLQSTSMRFAAKYGHAGKFKASATAISRLVLCHVICSSHNPSHLISKTKCSRPECVLLLVISSSCSVIPNCPFMCNDMRRRADL